MGSPTKKPIKRKNFEIEGSPEPKKARDNSPVNATSSQQFVPTAGRIKKIYLRNIMCHEALEVDFNPNVNFIVGKNGSGKSAILISLALGLGARASTTKRGDSFKSVMKNGCQKASIEITLTNVGPMAFKPELYGDSIKITRQFTVSSQGDGSSLYRIYSSRGKLISSKKKELTEIITSMNIQPENPISIMNQDNSQEFLKDSTNANRYELFMKATQLDLINNNYKAALMDSEDTKSALDDTSKQLRKEQQEIDSLKEKLERLESLEEAKIEYEKLQVELKWASVNHEEEMLAKAVSDLDECEKILEEREAAHKNEDQRIEEIDNQLQALGTEIKEIDDESQSSRDKYSEVKERYHVKRSELDAKKRDFKNCQIQVKHIEQNIKTLSDEIKRLEGGNSKIEQERSQQKEQLTKCKQELEQVEAMMKTNQVSQQHLEANKLHLENDEHSLKIEKDRKMTVYTSIMNQLTGLQQQSNDSVSVFGRNMPRLIKRIDEEHAKRRFKEKPVGPIGAYIKVKDQSWIPAIEVFLGQGLLKGFCVDNAQDSKILSNIIKEIYHDEESPVINCSKFRHQVHDVSRTCSGTDRFPNIFHSMEISNPIVANCIIDQRGPECVILIPTSNEATGIMQHAAHVPRNCTRAITKKGDTFYPDPKYRTYGGRVAARPRFLQVSTKDAIQQLQDDLNTVEREKCQVFSEYANIRDKLQENHREYNTVSKELYKLSEARTQLKKKIDKLNDTISEDNVDNCALFRNEKLELVDKLELKKAEETRLSDEITRLDSEVKKLGAETNKYREDVSNRSEKINFVKQKIQKLEQEKSKISSNSAYIKNKVQKAREDIDTAEESVKTRKEYVARAIEEAEATGPRIETKRSHHEINRKCQGLLHKIQVVEKQIGSKETLQQQLAEKLNKYKNIIEFYKNITEINKKHLKRVEERRREFHELKKIAGQKVRTAFDSILALRQYDGAITIDHGKKELRLEVIPRSNQKKTSNDVHTLSGGERSYSTVAFVLALWECTTLPFYFLDEFDVYMDKVNRRVIMDILLQHTTDHPERQFGFLTPLDASIVTASDTLTIHRMAPPVRTGGSQSQPN